MDVLNNFNQNHEIGPSFFLLGRCSSAQKASFCTEMAAKCHQPQLKNGQRVHSAGQRLYLKWRPNYVEEKLISADGPLKTR